MIPRRQDGWVPNLCEQLRLCGADHGADGMRRDASGGRLRHVVGRKRRRFGRSPGRARRISLQGRWAVLLAKSASSRTLARCAPTPRRASGSGWAPRSTVKRRPRPRGAPITGVQVSQRIGWTALAALARARLWRLGRAAGSCAAARPGSRITQGDNSAGSSASTLASALAVTVTDSAGPSRAESRGELGDHWGQREQRRTPNDNGVASVGVDADEHFRDVHGARASLPGAGDVLFTAIAQPIAGAITFRYLDAGGYHACGITTTEQLL